MANKNKVYVNPNFNRLVPPPTAQSKIIMHVNPNFSQKVHINRNKIHVNPNFVNTHVHNKFDQSSTINKIITSDQTTILDKEMKPEMVSTELPISKSRYTLIRQSTNRFTTDNVANKGATTIKINKYKSVSINNFKKKIEETPEPIPAIDKITVKINKYKTIALNKFKSNLEAPTQSKIKINSSCPTLFESTAITEKSTSYPQKYDKNRYKFYKSNSLLRLDKQTKPSQKILSTYKYRNIKLKVNKKSLKKNNIPCPLYRKYGKCLRSIKGTCEFLHDKKHVSVCRKFLKGLCRDETCLLSHDVSSKKMPTCNFYLKGMCTKDDCPYLHVKLNEKSKVCRDFLKGYCEKGDKCLNRHINVNTSKQNKLLAKRSTSSKALRKVNSEYNSKQTSKNHVKSTNKIVENQEQAPEESNKSENRYYNEMIIKSETETNDVIKPTRCKLGTLPSYIKF